MIRRLSPLLLALLLSACMARGPAPATAPVAEPLHPDIVPLTAEQDAHIGG